MIDLNNGLPIQDSGHALDDQVFQCASPSAEALFACVLDVTPSPDRSLENVGVVEDRLGISVVIIYMKCLFLTEQEDSRHTGGSWSSKGQDEVCPLYFSKFQCKSFSV